MSPTEILMVVLVITAFVIFALTTLLPMLKKKGVDVETVLSQTSSALATAMQTLETVAPFLPESDKVGAMKRITEAAEVAVGSAEQLRKIGELDPGDRRTAAQKYVREAVALAGITVTPEIEHLIDGAIQFEVGKLKPTY